CAACARAKRGKQDRRGPRTLRSRRCALKPFRPRSRERGSSPGARARRRASGARRTSGEGWREALLFVPSIRIGSTRKRPWDGDCTAKRFHRGGRGEEETTHRRGEERVHRRGHGEEKEFTAED